MMSYKGKVLVAMSGGIDSAMAAVILKEKGYQVIGITMKTWDYATVKKGQKETGCCNLESFNDARSIAVRYGFPHYILDIKESFTQKVIDNFINEYISGRTPNPCILCNTHIKWEALFKKAEILNCDYIATGHYAQIRTDKDRAVLSKSKDKHKDQSYVLWGLQQDLLKRTLFPIGNYYKSEIKAMAKDLGLIDLAEKKESYEICFIPDNNYRGFLNQQKPQIMANLSHGIFKNKEGKILGHHKGYPFYTIGQRKGLGISLGKATFVIQIIPETNTIVLGEEKDLNQYKMTVKQLNWIKYDKENISEENEITTKIRYSDKGNLSSLHKTDDDNEINVHFFHPVKSITPGQSAVFYENEDVIGGGFIKTTLS